MANIPIAPTTTPNPFRGWVPFWLKTVVAFIILIPVLLINGAYTGSNIDVSSYLGVLSEDINMAYYASSAGMAIAYLIIPKVKPIATTKTIILVVLLIQVLLSLICAETAYVEIIIITSFFIGYFKAFSLIETINILMPALSPSNTRNEFYAKFYPITLAFGQLSLVLTAELAYMYNWQYMYYFMVLLLLFAIIAVVICMSYARRLVRIPIKDIDWLSFFLVSACYMSVIYVATYGKTKDWFNSPEIVFATILIPITGWLFIRRQFSDTPFIDLSVLRNRNSLVTYILSFVLMFFASFSILISSYTTSILRLDSTKVNELYLYMIPGFVLGAAICYYWFLKAIRMAWLIFLGFACFTISIALLYFQVMPTGLYEDLYLPMFLRGVGMVALFVAFAIYGIQGLTQKQLIYNAFFMISARSALAPAIGSSILSNWLYRLTQQNVNVLSQNLDTQNPMAVSQFNTSVNSALSQGWSIEDAHKIATNALYLKVQIQATTVSIKNILGWMLIFGIILLIIILLYFFQFKPVRLMRMGNDMSG
ncbi:MFS transporter [Dysgonomonas sp. ZJ279]|uniref:MFS transporter n=1 Tax=Dysgonomonas sp. ZJ279 TaxID=2709796 RepID=UPI0013ED289E|nr:MFS transporter [Dysgonomonas sp. ZJ279]